MEEGFIETTWDLWVAGGWLMIPLALLVILIYYSVFDLTYYLFRHSFFTISPNLWRHWVDQPNDASGELGEIIKYTASTTDMASVADRFEEVRLAMIGAVDRRMNYCKVLIGVAPLTGLLGTVIGMLGTFRGLAVSGGGDTVDMVAGGISQALITTQTGLIVAIPAYVIISVAKGRRDQMDLFIRQLETAVIRRIEKLQKRSQAA